MPKYDQHFLDSPEHAERIARALGITPGEEVLEIGPGRGALTLRLLEKGARVTAVEIDPRMAEALGRIVPAGADFRLVKADFLEADLSALGRPAKVAGNLPYSVATPILQRLLEWPVWSTAALMFQKEVVERIIARPGEPGYGLLSVSVALRARAELLCDVPRALFRPPPKVESAVVLIDRLSAPRLPEGVGEGELFRTARAAFMHRRKMAAKSLSMALGLPREAADAAFRAAGLDPEARAERIPLEGFIALARVLKK
ncbi:MAG: 16S rRNA (adenine(1518)-N(6)/adenine(1519)-N(6))-dimethyltransferase RsmA [Elusimicrobiota bacterium]|jgi:16S rRNA (adenine1518-N6/adenine1519-N6)-dimethyltransferase